jgi:RHS repeat-associated protein
MRLTGWSMWLKCVGFVFVWLLLGVGVTSVAEASALVESGSSQLSSPLVVPEVDQMLGGQSAEEAEEARRASPEAVAAREESETKYEALGGEEAEKLVDGTFPTLVDQPAGGPPTLPSGEDITGFPSVYSAQVDLGGGHHGVIDSLVPMAVEPSLGRRVAMDLGLREANGAFEPNSPLVSVRIAKQLSGGVTLAESGVSLTPVDSHGVALSGAEGVVDGSSILFTNTQADEDTAVKPSTFGFETSTILRSVNSPSEMFYRVGLPEGASLVQHNEAGAVQVVKEGAVIATVVVPVAEDATGATVPVSMKVSGDILTVTAKISAGEFEYPIEVDPEVIDESRSFEPGVWAFYTDDPGAFEPRGLTDNHPVSGGTTYYHGDYGYFVYNTQGSSRIYAFIASIYEAQEATILDQLALRTSSGETEKGNGEGGRAELLFNTGSVQEWSNLTVCSLSTCGSQPVSGSEHNGAYFEQSSLAESTDGFKMKLTASKVEIEQEKKPTASFDTVDSTIEGQPNALLAGKWYKSTSNVIFGVDAYDSGIGLFKQGISSRAKSGWGYPLQNGSRNECQGVQCNECYESSCTAKASGNGKPLTFSLAGATGGELPEGEDTVEGEVEDEAGLGATAVGKIKIDNAPPTITSFSGLPSDRELVDGQHLLLKASAKSGLAGIASIVLDLDGQQMGGPQGGCSGSCTGHGEWELSGENYAAGEHTLTVIAEDNAGNIEKAEYHVVIHHPEGVAVGPGMVNPVTGELSLTATDVSIGVPGGSLTVARSYRSRHLAQGAEGPLGPQWNLGLGPQQSLTRVSGGMILTGSNGGQIVFESKGSGEFTSPTGDSGLVLAEKTKEGKTYFTLSENGSMTTFQLPVGGSGVWMLWSSEGPNGTNTMMYKFKIENGVVEPTEELAPVSANVSCGAEVSELKEGCRALKFEYDEGGTTAKGEKASEWGEFKGHLSKIRYIAWSASKAKEDPVVAEYAYDTQGRLRAVWNPQIKPELKTTYGYDSEGHVTAVSTPGHEPSLLEQGTIPADASPGRLLAVAVPSAGTALGSGEAPVSKEKEGPTLSSTSPKVGVKISVNLTSEKTPGNWSAKPLAFIYQWEDCNTSGKECLPIGGAVNQAYYPVAGDEGHELVAQVTALNATGATAASSAATSAVASGTPNTPLPEPPEVGSDAVTTLEYQVPVWGGGAPYEMSSTEAAKWGQADDPYEAMAIFPPDKVMGWPAKEYVRETVYYIDGKDRAVNTALPTGGTSVSTGAISMVEYNLYNDIVRTLSPDNRLKALAEGCKPAEECKYATENTYEEKGAEPGTEILSSRGPQHTVKLAVGKEGKANEEVLAREHTSYFYNEGAPAKGGPYDLVTKTIDGAETASKEEFDKRTTEMSYSGQSGLGWELRKPTSVITDPGGLDLVHTTEYNSAGDVTETKMPAANGKDVAITPTYASQFGSKGASGGQFGSLTGLAVGPEREVWVADKENSRVEEFSSTGKFVEGIGFGVSNGEAKYEVCTTSCQAGIAGSGNGQFSKPNGVSINQSNGDIYVIDGGNNRVEEFSSSATFLRSFGSSGSGIGQLNTPSQSAIDTSGDLWVTDYGNNRVEEFSAEGSPLRVVGWGVLNGKSEAETCTSSCQAGIGGSGTGQFFDPQSLTMAEGDIDVDDRGNDRIEEFSSTGTFLRSFGSKGTGKGQFTEPFGIALDPNNGELYITDKENNRVEEFTTAGTYLATFATAGSGNGQLSEPKGIAISSIGDIYLADVGNSRVEEWEPTVTGNQSAHDTKTNYYTAKEESSGWSCRNQPALAGLPCSTEPVAQPGTNGLPELPLTMDTYNIWNEPETITETEVLDVVTRTTTNTYDEAGRLKTTAISSTVGERTPTVTDEYNKETGALEKQCSNEGKPCTEGSPKTITTTYNRRGQLLSYTDAGENTTKYEYEDEGAYAGEKEREGRLRHVSDGKGTETYTYSETTGLPAEFLYENGITKMPFAATYDPEGNLLTESYPNGMTATYTYNQVGKPVSLVYKKTSYCTEEEKEKCKWFKDTVVPSIHGQWLEQTSTFSHQGYAYDAAGRLTQVQNTVSGKCTTRIYAYDEDTNRTSLTTREPTAEGNCASEGGKIQEHTYDTADRLTDPGIAYNLWGDITTLPAGDAEANGEYALTNTYYTDNQVASQKQHEQTIGYILDPAKRTLETVSAGKPNNSTIINHYGGPGNTPAWTENAVSHEWQRNITGINGNLTAIQNNGETPELQLTNLHGDIIAKAYLSETATELAAKADTSEWGVPAVSAPAKYSWLGAIQLPTELPSGVVQMGARSYVPQTGRFLQPDPISGGSANAYAYTFGDPIDTNDPTGDYTNTASPSVLKQMQMEGEGVAASGLADHQRIEREQREAYERYAAEQATHAAAEAAADAAGAAGPQYEEGEEWEEWYEEEGEYEYITNHKGTKDGKEEAHIEPAILVQPLGESAEGHEEGGESLDVLAPPPCVVSGCSRGERRHRHSSGGVLTCSDFASFGGGLAGGAIGGALAGPEAAPAGRFIGSFVGGVIGSRVC